jgi:ribonucleoside-diphosphate reductase alpha chain
VGNTATDSLTNSRVDSGLRDTNGPEEKLELTENSLTVLERRYLIKDDNGMPVETPVEMFRRVAKNIARADAFHDKEADLKKTEDEFYRLITSLEFMPNSPTLMNAGRRLQQLAACFVLPVEDNMESIFQAVKDTALVHKSGGGTGFSFSHLRPKNDVVSTTYGLSSGPVSFMQVFDAATHAVNQGGFRRGANMGILHVTHPDILEFITCKRDQSKLNNFNISVAATEEFMRAVVNDEEYQTVNPRNGKVVDSLSAREVFDLMVSTAWECGDPGIVFIDRIDADNPTPHVGKIESTNPCGEQPLLPYEACNLGSINLPKAVKDGKVDYDRLRRIVRSAVHFLDNVIDMSEFPIEKIHEMVHANRKIGLGVMGWADMLILLGIPYDSEEAIQLAKEVMRFITAEARKMSEELAQQRGSFPNFGGSIYDRAGGKELRNATLTTIAPTGTISIIAGCSSGIEPIFGVSFVRKNVLDNDELVEVNSHFERIAKDEGFYSEDLIQRIARVGSLKGFEEIPDRVKSVFPCAHDITPEWHVRMQAAFQEFTHNAVSKTVNFPRSATKEDVKKVYMLAYELGCKGVTIYRDGSRETQVLNRITEETATPQAAPTKARHRKSRPKVLDGRTIKMETGCGTLYITINEDQDGFFELFSTMGKAGGCAASQCEAIGRLVSLAWRSSIPTEEMVKQLSGICCHKHIGVGNDKILSCADAIAKAIREFADPVNETRDETPYFMRGACIQCGGQLEPEGGCFVCRSCGYSDCP